MVETSGAGKMYSMKPVFLLPERLPQAKVMYEMKNIHGNCRIASKIEQQVTSLLKAPHPEITALESRQEKILGQLAELKKIIANLSKMVKNQSNQSINQTYQSETMTLVINEETKKDPVTVDLVLKVNKSQIPYSLLALRTIWQDTFFNISCHTHSDSNTLKSDNEITSFEKLIKSNTQNKNAHNVVNLTLIWKNVNILETRAGFFNHCLLGEVTLLRFLSRLISGHNYEDQTSYEQLNLIDAILDRCYEVNLTRCKQVFTDAIKQFENALSKSGNTWLVSKSEPSIADIAAWSVIKSQPAHKLPNNVAKWFDKCQKIFCC